MPEIAKVWNDVKQALEAAIPESEYRTWFSHVKFTRLDASEAHIEVPSKFHAQWLYEKYLALIEGSLRRHFDPCPSIRFLQEKTPPQGPPPLSESKKGSPSSTGIRKDLTFDCLLTNAENRFAVVSAQKLAVSGQSDYSPLYLHGARGVGKTHLLHATGNRFVETWPGISAVYLSSKRFSSQCISAFHTGTVTELREGFRTVHLLLFDDVHLIRGQHRVQSEIIALMDSFQELKKPMVFASKKPPTQLEDFDDQLTSRLQSGLVIEIHAPDQDSKIRVLRDRFGKDLSAIPEDVLFFLAATTDDIQRLIEGVIRLLSFRSVQNRTIDISTAKALLKKRLDRRPDIEEIQKTVASYFHISPVELISEKKKRAFVYPRQMAMYICRTLTGLSYKEIGRAFGNRDHSSVIYAIARIQKERSRAQNVQNDVNHLSELLV
jgi:chromosomal replication initiator protein